jgi:recombination protein RecT
LLDRQTSQFAKVLPTFLTPERFVRVALTTINKNPDLLNCTETSLMACLMDAAQLGLETDNVMGRAYLIPYKDKCTLIIGYKGLIELAYRSGQVQSVAAHVVHEFDDFKLEYGIPDVLLHKPRLQGDRGKPIGAWAKVMLKDGAWAFDYMTGEEIAAIRKRSKAANNGPWVTDEMEMWRKTVVRRLSKYIPLSVEFRDAVSMEDAQEAMEEERLRAAKMIIPKSETTVPSQTALPEGEDRPVPMPKRTNQPEKETVPARHASQEEPAKKIEAQIPTGEPTDEEKSEIERQEAMAAANEEVDRDAAGALLKVMAIDSITPEELGKALRAFKIAIPRDFKGPDSMTENAIKAVMQAKAWNPIRLWIIGERDKAQKTTDQPAP